MVTKNASGSDRAIVFAIFVNWLCVQFFRFIPRSMGLFCRVPQNGDVYAPVIHYTISAMMHF